MRWITRAVSILFMMLLFFLWLSPATQRSAAALWTGCALTTGCALYLSLAYRRLLSTWRGFGALAVGLFLSLAWLRWQWPLWGSPLSLLQNVNLVVGLLAWALLIAVFVSSVLLLIQKDASVAFMGLAWVLVPLVLLAVSMQYGRMEHFLAQAPLGDQSFWAVPLMWALTMLCLGPPAFLAHYVVLLVKELKDAGS
jgi:hypothetical protein